VGGGGAWARVCSAPPPLGQARARRVLLRAPGVIALVCSVCSVGRRAYSECIMHTYVRRVYGLVVLFV